MRLETLRPSEGVHILWLGGVRIQHEGRTSSQDAGGAPPRACTAHRRRYCNARGITHLVGWRRRDSLMQWPVTHLAMCPSPVLDLASWYKYLPAQ